MGEKLRKIRFRIVWRLQTVRKESTILDCRSLIIIHAKKEKSVYIFTWLKFINSTVPAFVLFPHDIDTQRNESLTQRISINHSEGDGWLVRWIAVFSITNHSVCTDEHSLAHFLTSRKRLCTRQITLTYSYSAEGRGCRKFVFADCFSHWFMATQVIESSEDVCLTPPHQHYRSFLQHSVISADFIAVGDLQAYKRRKATSRSTKRTNEQ